MGISYKSLFINSFTSLSRVISGCYLVILSLALIQTLYRIMLYYWFDSFRSYLLLFFNAGIKPVIMLVMFGYISAFLRGSKTTVRETLSLDREYYIKFFIFYFALGFILFSFGGGVTFLAVTILFLRFPFIEPMLYFENKKIITVIRDNYHDIPKVTLRFLMVLLCSFMVFRYGFYKIIGSYSQTNQLVFIILNEATNAIFTYIYHAYMLVLFLTLDSKVRKKMDLKFI